MRALVLSDIHANIDALDSVLAEISGDTYDQLLVLGDLVGYGASPNEVVDRIYELSPDIVIRGNHDKVGARARGARSTSTPWRPKRRDGPTTR